MKQLWNSWGTQT